jgi:2'-deoxynucleoside 5'-phosphate N-hydrolase
MTTIYFSGSITGGREDRALYQHVIEELERDGHRVLAGSVAAEHVRESGDALHACFIFDRDMAWLAEADVLVAEVSKPSTGVGYEIAAARYRYGIPVICLYRAAYTKRCSAMVSGDRAIELIEYEDVDTMLPRLRESLRRERRSRARLPNTPA